MIDPRRKRHLDRRMKVTLFALFASLMMVGWGEVLKDPIGHARFVGDLGHKALTFESPKQKNRKAIREAKNGATSLYLYGIQFNDLRPLAELTHLESLHLRSISTPKDFSPLERLKNLTALRLEDSYLLDLSPLADLTNLKVLNLKYNKITDVSPLKGLTNLKRLYLYGNPIPEDQKEMLKKALPNCEIKFDYTISGSGARIERTPPYGDGSPSPPDP